MANVPISTLNQLQPYMQNFNTQVIVLDAGTHRPTNNGSIITMRVADATGSINATVINPEHSELFTPGDILRIRNGFGQVFAGRLQLSINRNGECKKTGDFCMVFSETPDISQQPLPPNTVNPYEQRDRNRQQQRFDRPPPSH